MDRRTPPRCVSLPSTAGGGSAGRDAVNAVRDAFGVPRDPRLSLHLTGSLPILVDQQAAAVRTEAIAVVGTIVLIILLLAARVPCGPCTTRRTGTRRPRVGTGGTAHRRVDPHRRRHLLACCSFF